MRRFIFQVLPMLAVMSSIFAVIPGAAVAQQPAEAVSRAATVMPTPRSEWLGSFNGIYVNGRFHMRLIRNEVEEGPRITYDIKGELGSKFRAAVDKNGILRIEEPIDNKRTTVTEVTVWCNDIWSLSVTAADLVFENRLSGAMFDMEVMGGASVRADFDVTDLSVVATGHSSVIVGGSAKYFKLDISTAKFDGSELSTVSSIVSASHSSEVRIAVSERLEGTTSTSAKIIYSGEPAIVRSHTTMFGGEIAPVEK